MRIIGKEKVTFGIRLKKLMQEHNPPMTQEELAGLLKNPAYEDSPSFNPHTISSWINDKCSLRRNRDKILQQLSDIFDVDPAYLECKQVEKRKTKCTLPVANNQIKEEIKQLEGFIEFLESQGIEHKFITASGHVKILEYIDSGYVYTAEISISDDERLQFSIDNKSVTLSTDECSAKIQELGNYAKYILFN